MAEKRDTLRLRFAAFFAALAVGGTALIAIGLWLGWRRTGGPAEGYVIAGLIGGFGLMGLTAWIGLLFDENVAKPILRISADLHTRATSAVGAAIDPTRARHLGSLGPASQAIHDALEETRTSLETALEEKMALTLRDKAVFETLLRELAGAVVVISDDGRILLYNRAATALLGPIGLDRPLARFLRMEPLLTATADLKNGPTAEPVSFLTTSIGGNLVLNGAVSDIWQDGERLGHVVLFRDTTEDLRTHGKLDRLLDETLEAARRSTSAMAAIVNVLQDVPDIAPEERTRFDEGLSTELAQLTRQIEASEEEEKTITARHWPLRDVALQQIMEAVAMRVAVPVSLTETDGTACCDGFAVTEILTRIANELGDAERTGLGLSATREAGDDVRLELSWSGPALPMAELDRWLDERLAPAYGEHTARDALRAHRTDIWVTSEDGMSRVVLPLPRREASAALRSRDVPDFYDFTLKAPRDQALGGQYLSALSYVVFDTETTGLDPQRDEIIQLAGARVLGQRLLRGEEFDQLVNPGRPIPPSSTEIHGITPEMVANAPELGSALAGFAEFTEDSVLVAHHAAFDLAFLTRAKAQGLPAIDRPTLCTARLSSKLFPHSDDHTLDTLARRLGVTIPEEVRHTALGDSIATAEVFLKLVPLLEARSIFTLNDALEWQGLR
ncbi:3'-5' exonuclease [Palleronia caenipelagi]|uniref:DNA-directed DNA polymerase n=1 Tax=Palleronia caenipelagi TaxID=2489174 RepID=A0A547PMM1_9RHOB|nr:exonuclease domain-containing protein [Palleronia caenipelagi]TRD15397.1 exonuclease [Palleronia caenipelagi]